jgi:uncharacterized surface protein with fasciclin (FAS1) repeats
MSQVEILELQQEFMADWFLTFNNKNIITMKNIYTLKKIVCLLSALIAIISCERNSTFEDVKPSITKMVVLNPDFSVLETAAIKGGVAGVLANYNPNDPSGHYTVFAPTNDAFAKLGLNSDNLSALNPTFLTNTLLYAASNGDLISDEFLPANLTASAFAGNTRRFINRNGDKYINGSKIITTDLKAINGTVHAIDRVLISSGGDIVQSTAAVAKGNVFVKPELTYLLAAVLFVERELPTVGIVNALATSPSLTVFAPSDKAFIDLGVILGLPAFKNPIDVERIPVATVKKVLYDHVIAGGKFTSEMNAGPITNLNGTNLTLGAYNNGVLSVKGPSATSTPGNMTVPDIQTKNGVVHIIDKIML